MTHLTLLWSTLPAKKTPVSVCTCADFLWGRIGKVWEPERSIRACHLGFHSHHPLVSQDGRYPVKRKFLSFMYCNLQYPCQHDQCAQELTYMVT